MNVSGPIQVNAEVTPNPNTLKFGVNRRLLESGSIDFPDKRKAQESPLASKLFEIESVNGVFIGTNFVTVTKTPAADWKDLIPGVSETLKAALSSSGSAVGRAEESPQDSGDPIERRIREILDREIRPAVAMDGGDVAFVSYEDGIVTLHLKGACSACPSAVMTLKMGVEHRLKSEIPEVKEVVQV